MVCTLASGPGSKPVAGAQKERLMSLILNMRGVPLVARIPRKLIKRRCPLPDIEGGSKRTYAKHSGGD